MCTDATLSFSTPLGSSSAVPQFHTLCATFASGQLAIFGAGVTAVLSAEIVLAVPYSAAPQLQNTAAVAGKVVVVQRGGSTFQEKATQAQVAGAVGVIIVNNVADDAVVMNITATVGIAIKIPVVMVSQSAEAALQASQGLRITIRPTPQSPVGNSGPLRLWRSSALTAGRLVQRAVLAFAGPSPMPPTAVPIQRTCTLSNGQVVPAGWSGKSSDNCNTCSCRNGFLACTLMACFTGTPAPTAIAPIGERARFYLTRACRRCDCSPQPVGSEYAAHCDAVLLRGRAGPAWHAFAMHHGALQCAPT